MFRSWYATCPRGAEPALEAELAALGAKGIRPGRGGVRFTGPRETALRACLELRCALRLLEPVGEFPCETQDELYAGALALPWGELVGKGQTFAISASGQATGLTHTHFVELRTKDAVVDSLRTSTGTRPDVNTSDPDVLVIVHLGNGKCSISLDLTGDLLSNRGYRVRTVDAPLREALAAAVIHFSGWDKARPLHDPVCGSGTLAIEAALLASARAPGLGRKFACERWPRTQAEDSRLLLALRAELTERARAVREVPPIFASDRDAAAVAATRENARAAGVAGLIQVAEADARQIQPMEPAGQLLLNVPYGERLEAGGRKQLKSFYHSLGQAIVKLRGHRAALLSSSEDFESSFGLRPRSRREIWNGPLRCELFEYFM